MRKFNFTSVAIALLIIIMMAGCSKQVVEPKPTTVITGKITVAPNWKLINYELEEGGDWLLLLEMFSSLEEGTYVNPLNDEEYAKVSTNPLSVSIFTEESILFIDYTQYKEWQTGDPLVEHKNEWVPYDVSDFKEIRKDRDVSFLLPVGGKVIWVQYFRNEFSW